MMLVLGARLTLRSGREALARLVLIAAAVAVGVTVLLAVLAEFNAFQATAQTRCWQCTSGEPIGAAGPGERGELWNYSEDYFAGRVVQRLDVAALSADAPVVPGLPRLPGPGQYYASAALTRLLAGVPRDELADRFAGAAAGEIGAGGLARPDDLVIIVGRTPGDLAALPATRVVGEISTRTRIDGTTSLYRYGIGMVAAGLLVPLLTLIGTATRLAAARREERFAAFRLAGATPSQVGVIASVEAVIGAAAGSLLGIAAFQPLRPVIAGWAVAGTPYFGDLVTPSPGQYAAVVLGVPLAAALAAVVSLRRVRLSPLGASRKITPPAPSPWRLAPLAAGLLLFAVAPVLLDRQSTQPAASGLSNGPGNAVLPVSLLGLLLTMAGLVLSGSWLTLQGAGLVARAARRASTLLASRRLADNPKAAFRSVGGLVLAVFVGTVIACVIPAVDAGMRAAGGGTLTDVLRVSFVPQPDPAAEHPVLGLEADAGRALVDRLRALPGTDVLPLYAPEARLTGYACVGANACGPTEAAIACADLTPFPALGRCAAGVPAIRAQFGLLLSHDNVAGLRLPFAGADSEVFGADPTARPLEALLVRSGDPASLERIRTVLSGYTSRIGATSAPKTIGESIDLRDGRYREVQQVALAVVAVTLLVAGCSLAVAVGGGLVERRRPFTLLRVTGTAASVLFRVVTFEAMVPLLLATAVAIVAGAGVAASVTHTLAPGGPLLHPPGAGYFATMAVGFAAAPAVIASALPLLRRMSDPDGARFE
ncbi:FtsX-like permease family protein [Dactylosporangium sp. CA-139066]|uniref:FtsX-like permease family protein n=1 Tax=Dactylosporangium sp. CA-139066 TaxID=3239930 RepID=UPI003D8BD7A6